MTARYEQETIISFNEEDQEASIYTHNKRWQNHLEEKLGLKPVMENSQGGKEYSIPKDRIRLPQKKRQLSEEEKSRRQNAMQKIGKKTSKVA